VSTAVRSREVVVDGIPLHVRDAGEGPALVLLHGLGASHAVWNDTIMAFRDRWRVVAPDLPGHGRSAKPRAPYTIDFYAGVVRSLGTVLGIDDAVVVGSSMGGLVATELAIWYPGWARALVLAAPAGVYPAAARGLGWVLDTLAGPSAVRFGLARNVRRCFYDPSSPGCLERERILAERVAAEDFPAFVRAVTRSLAGVLAAERQALDVVTQPVLLVWGREDRLVGLGGSARLVRAIPHARLAVIDACGHLPMLERPVEFNRLVADFLRAADAAPRWHATRLSG